jgi:hypothetical protein
LNFDVRREQRQNVRNEEGRLGIEFDERVEMQFEKDDLDSEDFVKYDLD